MDIRESLAKRICYELSQQGLMRTVGATVDEAQENVKKANMLVFKMLCDKTNVAPEGGK